MATLQPRVNATRLFCLALALLAGFAGRTCLAAETSPDAALTMVKRSLPFLEKEGVDWMEKRKCASCHQVPAMLWSLNRAADAGLEVDRAKLTAWEAWSSDWKNWNSANANATEASVIPGNTDTIALLLLARSAQKTNETWPEKLSGQLLKAQAENGSWAAGGQLPLGKRPLRETQEVSTMWNMLALKTLDKAPASSYERAMAWLSAAAAGKSTEWWVTQTLIQNVFGDKKLAQERRAFLAAQQNPDGGWGWLLGQESDAFGTGLALYGLSRAGVTATDPGLQKAIAFLQKTQGADGSWPVPSTRAKDNNQVKPTTVYWGTAWAVIGLLESRNPQ